MRWLTDALGLAPMDPVSRIEEEYTRTGDNATAVADGLARTARRVPRRLDHTLPHTDIDAPAADPPAPEPVSQPA